MLLLRRATIIIDIINIVEEREEREYMILIKVQRVPQYLTNIINNIFEGEEEKAREGKYEF